jgi:hypothetical protein
MSMLKTSIYTVHIYSMVGIKGVKVAFKRLSKNASM